MTVFFLEPAIAEYSSFLVGDASTFYGMNASGNSGSAGDGLLYSNGYGFTTIDSDHDRASDNCAVRYEGAWWHKDCHAGMLNGVYYDVPTSIFGHGITWKGFGERGAPRKTAIMSLQ